MPLDLEEQEQLDQLKAFWQKYRNLITGALTAALFAYAAYSGYQWWRTSQASAASQLYETMVTAINKGDKDQTLRAADDLQKQFARTPYAAMSSLVAAKIAAERQLWSNFWTIGEYQWPGVSAWNKDLKNVLPSPLNPNVVWNYWALGF